MTINKIWIGTNCDIMEQEGVVEEGGEERVRWLAFQLERIYF